MNSISIRKPVAVVVLCLAVTILLCGCPKDDGVVLTLVASPTAGGTVEATPKQAQYVKGAVVHVSATPVDGWRFNRWVGLAADPSQNSTQVTLDQNQTLTAVFEPIPKTGNKLKLEVVPAANSASITTVPAPDPATDMYRSGTVVTLTAEPACCLAGAQFVRWEGDVFSPTKNVTTVAMNSDKVVRAVVRPPDSPDYQVNAAVQPEGAGSVQVSPNQTVFFSGEPGTLAATPAQGYTFAFWIGDVANIIDSTTSFTATKDTTIVAVFKPTSGASTPHAVLFGNIDGPMAEQIEQQFPNVVTEIGTEARGLIMPGSAIETVNSDASKADGLKRVFDAGFPVILTAVTVAQIAVLEEILDVAPEGIELESGESSLAYFGIDLEPDGKVWRLVGHMPRPGDTSELPQSDTWRVQCVATLEAWLLKDGHRADDFPGTDAAAEKVLKSGYEDLVKLATANPLQVFYSYTYTDTGNSDAFVLTTFPYSCHSLTGSGIDYFYVIQYGAFSGSGSYKYTDCTQEGGYGLGACDSARYLYEYSMYTQIPGVSLDDGAVTIYSPSPVTYSGANTTVTSGSSWSMGGSFGVNTAQGPTFSITSGVQVTNSTTISIPDVTITQRLSGFNEPHWTYDLRRVWKCDYDMCGPALMAQGTFAPVNQWLFYIQPSVRTKFPASLPLNISFTALQASDYIDCDKLQSSTNCTWHTSTSKTMTTSQAFTVPWPPKQ